MSDDSRILHIQFLRLSACTHTHSQTHTHTHTHITPQYTTIHTNTHTHTLITPQYTTMKKNLKGVGGHHFYKNPFAFLYHYEWAMLPADMRFLHRTLAPCPHVT